MIEPRYANLQKLFADRVFRIPAYQRFYSWQSKQRLELFSDLRKLSSSASDQHHFMATIVCNRTRETIPIGTAQYVLYDVVDGQQRLTTLIILLKCIELALPESEDRVELGNILVKRDGHLILLQTNNANADFFNSFIREGRKIEKKDIQFKSDLNLLSAIQDCTRFVAEWRLDKTITDLMRIVLHRLGFVVYDTDDSRAVYTLFEVLNSRGLAVDWLDKTKSALMGRTFDLSATPPAAEAAIDNLQKQWGSLYLELAKGDVLGEHVLQATATLYYPAGEQRKPSTAEDSLDALREACSTPDDAQSISRRLVRTAKILTALDQEPEMRVVSKILHARILYVALQLADGITEHERANLLSQWERVTFRIFGLLGRDSRTKIGDYVSLGGKIVQNDPRFQSYNQIMSALRQIGRDFPVSEAVEAGLLNPRIYLESPDICRYVLWQYEEFLALASGEAGTVDAYDRARIWDLRADDSIEHIYPQNPGIGWFGKLNKDGATDEDNERHAHRIGNLLLLPQPINSAASQRPFLEKRPLYGQHNLRMIDEVLEKEDWNLSEINAREVKITQWALKRWENI